jgi:arylsulfatase
MKTQPTGAIKNRLRAQVGRRDLLRYCLSFAAVSALGNTSVSALAGLGPSTAQPPAVSKPNIVFLLMDNLGYGEVGCYGGGITRGAPTPRIDKLATEGTRSVEASMV